MPPSSRTDELPIIRAYYDFTLWLMPKMSKFPREHRFTLGQRIERLLGIRPLAGLSGRNVRFFLRPLVDE